jgi:hypothetical protein
VRVAQVAQAVEPHPRREPPAELRLGGGIDPRPGRRNAARKRGVIERVEVGAHDRRIATIGRVV